MKKEKKKTKKIYSNSCLYLYDEVNVLRILHVETFMGTEIYTCKDLVSGKIMELAPSDLSDAKRSATMVLNLYSKDELLTKEDKIAYLKKYAKENLSKRKKAAYTKEDLFQKYIGAGHLCTCHLSIKNYRIH